MITIRDAIRYVGVNDHQVDLFEGQYSVPNGMSYNSYVILDEKIAVMDTVDIHFTHEWLDNLTSVLNGRTPDYLIIQHMEPDHSANILNFLKTWPNTTIVATEKAFSIMENFFDKDLLEHRHPVKEGDSLSLGSHVLHFVCAPMVHWPEVMFTYESTEQVLFSADAFGKFGALDVEEPWDDEARRYYIGIVGKYGAQVQSVLKKAANLDIQNHLPASRPHPEGGSGPLSWKIPALVLLYCRIGRCADRLYIHLWKHKKSGRASCRPVKSKRLPQYRSLRSGKNRYGKSRCRCFPL